MADGRDGAARRSVAGQGTQPKAPKESLTPGQPGGVPPELVATSSAQAPAAEYWPPHQGPGMYWQPPHPGFQRWMPYPPGQLMPSPQLLSAPVGYHGMPMGTGGPYQLGGYPPYPGPDYQQPWYQNPSSPAMPSNPLPGLSPQQLQQLQQQQQQQQQPPSRPLQSTAPHFHPQLPLQPQQAQRTTSRLPRKYGHAGRAGRQPAASKPAGSAASVLLQKVCTAQQAEAGCMLRL